MKMKGFKKAISLMLAVVLVISFNLPAAAIVAYPLNNGLMRFGTGSEDSINTKGTLQQPWYKNAEAWYKLTFSSYPLNYAVGIGGTNNGAWNTTGTIATDTVLSSQTTDYSGLTGDYATGYTGVVVTQGRVTIDGKQVEITNRYELLPDKSYLKTRTTIKNLESQSISNVRYWTGTQDDYVGGSDSPTKTKGNLANGEFVANTGNNQQAKALKISGSGHNVLFFSTHATTEMIINLSLSFPGVTATDPRNSTYTAVGDDSYGMYVLLGDLAAGASTSFDWYYAAGSSADIGDIVEDIDNDADNGASSDAFLTDLDLYDAFETTSGDAMVVTTGDAIVFTPEFDFETTTYSAIVPYETDAVSVIPTTTDAAMTITVDGEAVDSGNPSGLVDLAVGSNTINVLVTAEDGETTRTYTLNIVREDEVSSEAYLINLELFEYNNTTGAAIDLSPDFETDETAYTASVSYGMRSAVLVPTTTDAAMTITVNGDPVDSGEASGVIDLAVGSNTITVVVTAEDGETTATYTLLVTRAAKLNQETTPTTEEDPVYVIVNGEKQDAGAETLTRVDGNTVFTVDVDEVIIENKIEQILADIESGALNPEDNEVQIPISNSTADEAVVALNGDIVKLMEENDFNLSITRDGLEYRVPADEFTIDQVAQELGVSADELADIEIEIKISTPSEEDVAQYKAIAEALGVSFIIPPVSFEITAKTTMSDGTTKEVEIDTFNTYVERIFEVPAGVDPAQITTGIVFNADGTYEHVPTVVYEEDGVWYVKISSLTNSVYSVIYSPVSVASVEAHWSQTAVEDMASRQVIANPESFMPDAAITRGDFAEYIAKAIGVYRTDVAVKVFSDVDVDDAQADAIFAASNYGIIEGYPDGTFRPEGIITRQEAMVMFARAMDVVALESKNDGRVNKFADAGEIAAWALEDVTDAVGSGVFNGRSSTVLDVEGTLTYAEAATAVRNMLVEAGLINE